MLHIQSLEDLTDSRVLCALINSFVPDTFTTEVLLNDRYMYCNLIMFIMLMLVLVIIWVTFGDDIVDRGGSNDGDVGSDGNGDGGDDKDDGSGSDDGGGGDDDGETNIMMMVMMLMLMRIVKLI